MPVRFVCPDCLCKLSVTRRKVGCQVICPKCSASVTVPDAESARLSPLEATPLLSEPLQGNLADLVNFDELPDLVSRARPVPLPPTSSGGHNLSGAQRAVSISRNAIYMQALLMLLIAAVAFGMGYWFGSLDSGPPKGLTPVRQQTSVAK